MNWAGVSSDIATTSMGRPWGRIKRDIFMQELDDYIDKVKNLPPAPRILPELLTLLNKEDIDCSKVVDLISYDPGITASVLRLCNSACLGGATPADDLQEAVGRVGFRQVYLLVATVSGSRVLGTEQRGYGIDGGNLWRHSVTSAVASQILAEDLGRDSGLVFTAALLHDIGKIVLAEALEHIYARLVEESQCHQASMLETEKRLLGVHHAEVGARLLSRWKFPPSIVAGVTAHHQPALAESDKDLAALVYLGNMIAYFIGFGYGQHPFALRGRAEALEILDLKPETVPDYMIRTIEKLQMVEGLIKAAA